MDDLFDFFAWSVHKKPDIVLEDVRAVLLRSGLDCDEIRKVINELRKIDWYELAKLRDAAVDKKEQLYLSEIVPCEECRKPMQRRENKVSKYKGTGIYALHGYHCADCMDKIDALYEPPCLICGEKVFVTKRNRGNVVCPKCANENGGDAIVYFEKARVDLHNTRAKSRGQEGTLTLTEWMEILRKYEFKCAYCGRQYEALEHHVPLSRGGGTVASNCVPSCHRCNSTKGAKHPEDITMPIMYRKISHTP